MKVQAGVSARRLKRPAPTLGHPHLILINETARKVLGMHISKEQDAAKSSDCLDCLQWKMPRQTYGSRPSKARAPMELVHSDYLHEP